MVNNTFLEGIYKDAVIFFLETMEENINDIVEKLPVNYDDLLQQINSATIDIESTPYYCIMKFYHNGAYEDFYDKTIEIQVVHENFPPIVFHMYLKNGVLYEFEYFKADSSEMHNEELFIGDIIIEIY